MCPVKAAFTVKAAVSSSLISPTIIIFGSCLKIWRRPEAKVYPISGFTWIIVYKEQNYNNRSAANSTAMLKMLWWMTHDGQKYCADLNYAPLPKAAVKVSEKILKSVGFNGKSILK